MTKPLGNYAALEDTLERTMRELETAWAANAHLGAANAHLAEKYDACVKQCNALERDNKRLTELLYGTQGE